MVLLTVVPVCSVYSKREMIGSGRSSSGCWCQYTARASAASLPRTNAHRYKLRRSPAVHVYAAGLCWCFPRDHLCESLLRWKLYGVTSKRPLSTASLGQVHLARRTPARTWTRRHADKTYDCLTCDWRTPVDRCRDGGTPVRPRGRRGAALLPGGRPAARDGGAGGDGGRQDDRSGGGHRGQAT